MAKFGVKEVADVVFFDIDTNEPVLFFDSLKISTLENGAETVHATGGRGNARLISWDFNRTATFNVQDALLDVKALAAQSGNALETTALVQRREVLTVESGKVTVSKTPAPGTPIFVFKWVDNNLGDKIENPSASGAEITLSGAQNGDKVVVFYQSQENNVQAVTISSDKFPGYYRVVGDTVVRNNVTGVDEPFQIVIHKAKLLPGFTITLDAAGEPSVFDFNLEVSRAGDSTEMIKFIKYTD